MSTKLIGYVGVDSGQLMLCDPCYIDSEWKKEDFDDVRVYRHKTTGDILQYRVDFPHYEAVIEEYGKTMNELNASGEWEKENYHTPVNSFSYNACAKATLSEQGYGQLNYNLGHPGVGVAFSTAHGDGVYPVYATYDKYGLLLKVEVHLGSSLDEDSES